jgi:signal transduction histidine kinase
VLGNLLGNALKYSPGGGVILISVRRTTTADGAWASLSVRDPGIGIPAADVSRIFEAFQRGANVANRIPGTGIGLASALRIARAHGGNLTVESVEGAGSTFTLRLPLS